MSCNCKKFCLCMKLIYTEGDCVKKSNVTEKTNDESGLAAGDELDVTPVEQITQLPNFKVSKKDYEKSRNYEFSGQPYIRQRLKDQNFRRHLVGLVVKPELPYLDYDFNNDKDVNRFQNYITNGVEIVFVAPLQSNVIATIKSYVPENISKCYSELLDLLIDEVKNEFMITMKNAILEYVLDNPFKDDDKYQVVSTCLRTIIKFHCYLNFKIMRWYNFRSKKYQYI